MMLRSSMRRAKSTVLQEKMRRWWTTSCYFLYLMATRAMFIFELTRSASSLLLLNNAIVRTNTSACRGALRMMKQQHSKLSVVRKRVSPFELRSLLFHRCTATWRMSSSSTSVNNSNSNEDEEEEKTPEKKTIHSTWNLQGLVKETNRCITRCYKKIDKASTRYTKALQHEEDDSNSVASLVILEEMKSLKQRLADLHELLEQLLDCPQQSSDSTILPEQVATLAIRLEVNDTPPPPKKIKKVSKDKPETNTGPRKPYRRYYTENNTEIRVGKAAEDNDELSLNPKHRDGSDWWLHASGCPGSHVVIRTDADTPEKDVVQDAAALAARQSKCTGNIIKVSMTRCRDIVKPPGAKAGLLQLRGNVRTVVVNMKEAQSRLERLDKTVLVN